MSLEVALPGRMGKVSLLLISGGPGKKQPCVPTHFTQEAWGPSTAPITPFLHACVGIRIASKTKKGGNKLTCGISNMTQNSLSMK